MNTWILFFFISTSIAARSGAAGANAEFFSEAACIAAGKGLAENAIKRENHVLTWGCFPKGQK